MSSTPPIAAAVFGSVRIPEPTYQLSPTTTTTISRIGIQMGQVALALLSSESLLYSLFYYTKVVFPLSRNGLFHFRHCGFPTFPNALFPHWLGKGRRRVPFS